LILVQEARNGVTFAVRVHPRAKKNAITGEVGDALKLSVTAPPIDGEANAACIEFFAKLLKVARASVTIASGETRRAKVIRVSGLSAAEVRKRLGLRSGPDVNVSQTRARAPAPRKSSGSPS